MKSTPKGLLNDGIFLGSASCFLSLLGASLTIPFLQAQRDKLGCDALCYGAMQSTRSGLSIVGTFLVGRLSDRMGRSQALWLGNISTLFSYFINISSNSIIWMWISMIPSSLLNQNFSVMKALFADYSSDYCYNESQRASAIGRLGMSAGLSFMVGPVVGAFLFHSYSHAAIAAIALTILSSITLIKLPTPRNSSANNESAKLRKDEDRVTYIQRPITVKSIQQQILQFVYLPALETFGAKLLLLTRFCMSLAFNIFMVIWTVSLKSRFSFGPKDHAFFMAWIGLWYALSQGFLAKIFISYTDGGKNSTWLLQICVVCLSFGRVLAMMTSSLAVVYLVMAIVIIALGIMNTAISAASTHLAGKNQMGGLYGIFEAAESFGGIIGPTLGGLLARTHPQLPIISVVAIYGVVFIVLTFYYERYIFLAHLGPSVDSPSALRERDTDKDKVKATYSASKLSEHETQGGFERSLKKEL